MSNPLEELMEMLSGAKKKKERVARTIVAKPEWVAEFKDFYALKTKIEHDLQKAQSIKAGIWSRIEAELDCYSTMRFNEKLGWIEILEDTPDGDDED